MPANQMPGVHDGRTDPAVLDTHGHHLLVIHLDSRQRTGSNFLAVQNVDSGVVAARVVQDLHNFVGKSAARGLPGALDKGHDGMLLQESNNCLLHILAH